MSEAEKDRATKYTYHGESGFGSIFQTYKDAKAKVPHYSHLRQKLVLQKC